jgi:hypothetical protein
MNDKTVRGKTFQELKEESRRIDKEVKEMLRILEETRSSWTDILIYKVKRYFSNK